MKTFTLTLIIGIIGYVLGRVEQYLKQKRKEDKEIETMLEVLSASTKEQK